jgi:hypothetical protein
VMDGLPRGPGTRTPSDTGGGPAHLLETDFTSSPRRIALSYPPWSPCVADRRPAPVLLPRGQTDLCERRRSHSSPTGERRPSLTAISDSGVPRLGTRSSGLQR